MPPGQPRPAGPASVPCGSLRRHSGGKGDTGCVVSLPGRQLLTRESWKGTDRACLPPGPLGCSAGGEFIRKACPNRQGQASCSQWPTCTGNHPRKPLGRLCAAGCVDDVVCGTAPAHLGAAASHAWWRHAGQAGARTKPTKVNQRGRGPRRQWGSVRSARQGAGAGATMPQVPAPVRQCGSSPRSSRLPAGDLRGSDNSPQTPMP